MFHLYECTPATSSPLQEIFVKIFEYWGSFMNALSRCLVDANLQHYDRRPIGIVLLSISKMLCYDEASNSLLDASALQ